MAKAAPDATIDQMLSRIAEATRQYICSAQPTSYAEATSTYALGYATMTAGHGNDYTIADGDSSGRKVTTAQKTSITPSSNGTATHLALVTVASNRLDYVTTCTSRAITTADSVTIPAWKVEVADPT